MSENWKSKLRYFRCNSVIAGECTCAKSNCSSAGKHPKSKGWQQEALDCTPELLALWEKDASINLGILCGEESDLFVLDVDGQEGSDTLYQLGRKNAPLPTTYTVKTGSGGFHFYFKFPHEYPHKIQNKVKFAPGLDIRTTGGLVIAAGARHISSNLYEATIEREPIKCPTWLLDVIVEGQKRDIAPSDKSANRKSASTSGVAMPAELGVGARNVTLFRLGSLFRRYGATESVLLDYLQKQNREICKPPLSEQDVRTIAASCARYEPELFGKDTLTESWAAERFAQRYADQVRYAHDLGRWYVFDGGRWKRDRDGAIHRCVKDFIRELHLQALALDDEERRRTLLKFACNLESRNKRDAIVALSEKEQPLAVTCDVFDNNHWLLNVQNGTIDLKSGELQEHDRHDMITQLAAVEYDPSADCPKWKKVLAEIFVDQPETIRFIQQAFGYSLFGKNPDELFFYFQGSGGNGKGTLLRTMVKLLGDYAISVDFSIFVAKPHGDAGPRDGKLKLRSKRLVLSSEPSKGQKLNEGKIKEITAPDGDKITAGVFYKEDVEIVVTHTLFLSTNPELGISANDGGMWRRIHRINFNQKFENPDNHLKDDLEKEFPGVLNWALEGLREYLSVGKLVPPAKVEETKKLYRERQDPMVRFLEAYNEPEAPQDAEIQAARLYLFYKDWAYAAKEFVLTETKFGIEIKRHLKSKKTSKGTVYFGFRRRVEGIEPDSEEAKIF